MKIKNKVKDTLTEGLDLKFDTSKLESNEKKEVNYKKVALVTSLSIIATSLVLVVAVPFIAMTFRVNDNYKAYKRNYSINELNKIESDSFKSLNTINYPNRTENTLDDNYINAVNNFTYVMYNQIKEDKNYSFSPMGLYANLSINSLGCSSETLDKSFDNLLGVNKETRNENYKKFYSNNYFANEEGTVQMYNGFFASNRYEINSAFISSLNDYYAEAYSCNFNSSKDVNRILSWVDQKVDENNFLTEKDLEITDDSAFINFSTLYFNNKWATTFNTSKTYTANFYKDENSSTKASYMKHSYHGKCYDYDTFMSVHDYYKNGYSVQYLFAKDLKDNINDLISNRNFLVEDEDKSVNYTYYEDENGELIYNYNVDTIINLSVPKFDNTTMIDFTGYLKNLGLEEAFDEYSYSLNNVFTNLNPNESIYLKYVKQKNNVSFSEDGTTIKSVTFSMGMGATSAAPMDTIDIRLDRPFIYIIYDQNNIPLYAGYTKNPN